MIPLAFGIDKLRHQAGRKAGPGLSGPVGLLEALEGVDRRWA